MKAIESRAESGFGLHHPKNAQQIAGEEGFLHQIIKSREGWLGFRWGSSEKYVCNHQIA
jgi:hypothetical protein